MGFRILPPKWVFLSTLTFYAVLFGLIESAKGQSGFYFGQPDNRFVPNVQTNINNGGRFFPSNFGNQYRAGAPPTQDFSQQEVFGAQRGQNFQQNYDRNNQQFQSGRSQPAGNYFITQTDFQSRPNQYPSRGVSPTSFHVNHPASTGRPEFTHFVQQSSHNHDPSKPEVFLGQITINNPDPFPNNPENDQHLNNLRIRPPGVLRSPSIDLDTHFPSAAEPVNQDIFEYTDNIRATTYNPRNKNKASNRIVHNPARPNFVTSKDDLNSIQNKPISTTNENFFSSGEKFGENNRFKSRTPITTTTLAPSRKPPKQFPVTKSPKNNPAVTKSPTGRPNTPGYRPLFDLAPLLEDEIPDDYSGNRSATNGSEDVQVIKSSDKPSTSDYEDLRTSEVEKVTKSAPINIGTKIATTDNEHSANIQNETVVTYSTEEYQPVDNPNINNHNTKNVNDDDSEFYDEIIEYIDEEVPSNDKTKHVKEEYDEIIEYEEVDESAEDEKEESAASKDGTYEILTMKPKPMVKDDNFKEFIDSGLIDNTEHPVTHEYVESIITNNITEPSVTVLPSILGEEVVSVVTTKSVVNGTYSVPNSVETSSTLQVNDEAESTLSDNTGNVPNSTESWFVVASVQTSRSVSGARFLPFPGIAQEEKKQTIAETEDEEEEKKGKQEDGESENVTGSTITETNTKSTESIIDKLDRVQSELSIDLLTKDFKGDDKNIDVITEMAIDRFTQTEMTTIPTPLQIFTVKSTSTTSTTEKSSPEPPPVVIKKFSPHSRLTTTTTKPKSKIPAFETIVMDDLAGLLPAGYKPRPSFKDRKITTTTSTTTTTKRPIINENQGRSSGLSFKNRIEFKDDISSLLPAGYKPPKEDKDTTVDDVIKSIKAIDVSHLLPPGYKPEVSSETPSTAKSNKGISMSALLPKGYEQFTTTTERPKVTTKKIVNKPFDNKPGVDISAFLPPGYKPPNNSSSNSSKPNIPESIKIADISSFLPPGFKLNKDDKQDSVSSKDASTTQATIQNSAPPVVGNSGSFKVVFPSRPGAGKPGKRLTTPKPEVAGGTGGSGGVSVPSIQKGWPTRATTAFTGWPTISTTPFSIDKWIEESKNAATANSVTDESLSSTVSTTTTTSTTPPTSTTTMVSTTPGICSSNCDLAATIKIVGGVKWVPELLNHNTEEWQYLANEVSRELDIVYSKSPALKKWYKGVRIDAFSEGSVLVDYFVELNDVGENVDTSELKKLFHKSLTEAKAGSVLVDDLSENHPDKLTGRKIDASALDEELMLGDQPPEDKEPKKKDISKGKLEIGKFILDPAFTEFIVLPKRNIPTVGIADENNLLPQWGIAVIVIALASLLFVVIFGVTVIVNRQKNAKAKQPIPLSEDMLRELDKSHMGGDLYLQEHEPPYHKVRSQKRNSTTMLDPLEAYPGNPGDSWRSEWGPYYSQFSQSLQQQQQHYAPDSGRGSGNYGYSGSQIYGYNGGGSQNYGYSGEGVRTLYPRRRSDFDSNF